MEESQAVEENDADYEAAFNEAAKESLNADQPTEEGPGAVGLDDEQEFDQSFTDAAVSAAASRGDVADVDLAAKLAEMEAETERLKQSERSQRGRVSALTRKLVEQQQKAKEKPVEAEPERATSTNWDEFKEEFPEMAAIVDERLGSVDHRINSVSNSLKAVNETQSTMLERDILAYKEAQFDVLAEKHSDFDQIKGSREFADFKATANTDIQAKIKSKHAEDAIAVLDAFKEQTGWKTPGAARPGKSEVEKINERRAAALKRSTGISSKGVGHSAKVDAGSDDDFDSAFAARASKIEARRSVRY